ncbi:MAG: ATP-binding protein [Bryobacteraceae bacterium]|nr:PAS domain-containing protein [Solibacteraceae bacterium]MCL4840563.1 PAS domain-containing protein [Bryobacteraceae bacterium]MCO5350518.1 ATP-binding protein [Bryobacteraceae bacterium]
MGARFVGVWRETLRIVGIYLLAGAIWIGLSDLVLWRYFPQESWPTVSVFKGIFFVTATGLLLAVLLVRAFSSIHRSQRALDDTRKRFTLFMDNLPVAAFLKDAGGNYLFVNRFLLDRFAGDHPLAGSNTRDIFPQATADRFAAADRRVLDTRLVHESEVCFDQPSGPEYWLVRRFPVPTGNGDEALIGGVAIDITERHRLDEQIRQTGKMEALGRVAGGIAHDFNNMLTVVNGYASLLHRELGDSPAGRKAREIQIVGEKAAHLTHQLLAFSRKQQHQPERLELNRVIREMESVIRPLIPANVEFVFALDPTLPPILADHAQLQQIVLNLALNARDAMPDGGILSFETRKLPADAVRPVHLTVRDNGHGMDAAVRERIFEPFFTTKEPGKGIGLGLATVYGAVRQNGGAIKVDSEPGRGAVFTVSFSPAE